MNYANSSRAQLEDAYSAARVLATRHFQDYCKLVGDVKPADHHQLLIEKLEAVECGEITRLMFFLPPGHAKSTYASILFPAYYIGKNPKNTIISASYSATLSERFGRKVRDQVGSPYFPFDGITLSERTKAKGEWETNLGGEYFAAGVGGGITGRRADFGIIDDPIKGRADADSETIRESTWEWFKADFRTRLKPNAPIVLIQTRWHEDDLAGRILPESYDFTSGKIAARDGEKWEVINLPAIAEENDFMGRRPGEALWPAWMPVKMLDQERKSQGLRNWISLYQQRPSPETGSYIKREWIKYYDEIPAHTLEYGASDYAVSDGEGDFTEHGVISVDPNNDIYIRDWWHGQTNPDVWIEEFCNLVLKHKPQEWAGERGQISKSVGPFLERRMQERNAYVYIEEHTPSVNKQARAQAFRGLMAQGKIYWPKDEWAERIIKQLLAFPSGKYDDAVDVCGLFGTMLMKLWGGVIPVADIQKPSNPSTVSISDVLDDERDNDIRNFWQ